MALGGKTKDRALAAVNQPSLPEGCPTAWSNLNTPTLPTPAGFGRAGRGWSPSALRPLVAHHQNIGFGTRDRCGSPWNSSYLKWGKLGHTTGP